MSITDPFTTVLSEQSFIDWQCYEIRRDETNEEQAQFGRRTKIIAKKNSGHIGKNLMIGREAVVGKVGLISGALRFDNSTRDMNI